MSAVLDSAPGLDKAGNMLPSLREIEDAARVVYREFQATPQYRWGLSSQRLGTDCWIKHENHTPVGAFKLRGGLTYFEALKQRDEMPNEVISATRGNHGQSIGWAARAKWQELRTAVGGRLLRLEPFFASCATPAAARP